MQRSAVLGLGVLTFVFQMVWGPGPVLAQAAEPFALHDGDRVVFVGDGFIERAQRFGYIEAALTARWPNRSVTFRNVGWSGDTVFGEARDHFTNPPTAYEHLIEQITAPRPTVIVMGYGGYLAFEPAAALPPFVEGMHRLLDDLAATEARVVLLAPVPHHPHQSPNPGVLALNDRLERVRDALETVAQDRGHRFVDLFAPLQEAYRTSAVPLTTNGLHLNAEGYRLAAQVIAAGLIGAPVAPRVTIDVEKGDVTGAHLEQALERDGNVVEVALTFATLAPASETGRPVAIRGLRRGRYTLWANDAALATASAADWANGVTLVYPAEHEQAEALRQTIIDKNRLYFRQYRPQNETYLVGFRNYEQGQNADELDQYEPIIAARENDIGRLRVPRVVRLSLRPA